MYPRGPRQINGPALEPASPCIGICKMNEQTGLCIGCFRTRNEIAMWSSAGAEDKRRILDAVVRRGYVGDVDAP